MDQRSYGPPVFVATTAGRLSALPEVLRVRRLQGGLCSPHGAPCSDVVRLVHTTAPKKIYRLYYYRQTCHYICTIVNS